MESVIKNIEPDTYQNLLSYIISSDIKHTKKAIEKRIRNRLGIVTSHARRTRNYWLLRGWSKDEAYVRAKENKHKNIKSVYSRKFWLEKINPDSGNYYTINEADFERNSRRSIKKEYWIKKGYIKDEAIRLAKETKKSNNKKGANQSANSDVRRITSKRCTEYYTVRGYSKEEAKKLVSEGQRHFSKEICIEKYGQKKGLNIWKDRQDKWQETLNNKSPEEIARINRLKTTKGITVSKAEKEILSEIQKINPNILIKHQLTLFANNKKQYIYDLASGKKIIEYNGDFWHCNPKQYSAEYINPRTKVKALDKWAADQEKIKFAKGQGYEVLVVWESEFKENQEEVLNKCIQFLIQ